MNKEKVERLHGLATGLYSCCKCETINLLCFKIFILVHPPSYPLPHLLRVLCVTQVLTYVSCNWGNNFNLFLLTIEVQCITHWIDCIYSSYRSNIILFFCFNDNQLQNKEFVTMQLPINEECFVGYTIDTCSYKKSSWTKNKININVNIKTRIQMLGIGNTPLLSFVWKSKYSSSRK